jgi:hypothetical protein
VIVGKISAFTIYIHAVRSSFAKPKEKWPELQVVTLITQSLAPSLGSILKDMFP